MRFERNARPVSASTTRNYRWTSVLVAVLMVINAHFAVPSRAGQGFHLVKATRLNARLQELVFFSPALASKSSVYVLTPTGFDPRRDHLPVLWLLHGQNQDYRSWVDSGRATDLTARLHGIVVMPDNGPDGWYSDWLNPAGSAGPQQWQTYHLDELRPWVERHFATRTDRAGRGIMGLSMGGFGAILYAARHPDLFGYAASFSGAVDNRHPAVSAVCETSAIVQGGQADSLWGSPVTDETNWRAHNPIDLAENLTPVTVELHTGDGLPGGSYLGVDPIEQFVHQTNITLHDRLLTLRKAHVWDDYGPGGHDWPHWQHDLQLALPDFVALARTLLPEPTTIHFLAFAPTFSVWGWAVTLHRINLERTLLVASRSGFVLSGSGLGTVTSPPWFLRNQKVRVRDGSVTRTLTADATGRLAVPVNLGPANSDSEYPRPPGMAWYRQDVTVTFLTKPRQG